MDKIKKPLAILNLSGELSPELTEYFATRNIRVVNFIENGSDEKWTHVLTRDIQYFDLVNSTYNLAEAGGHIISLSKVDDLRNFTQNFGNLILDDGWLTNALGTFILDKYFQSYGGVHLGNHYPALKESGSFAIVNPFSTGEYVDRLVQKGFEAGVEALAVKTFFDHLIMFIAGLKNKGRAGLPIEVTFGGMDNVFAVQLNFSSKNIKLSDISSSLSNPMSRIPEEYYLNVTAQASDFFDVSFLPEVQKVVITGLWTQEKKTRFENRGLMLMDVERDAPKDSYDEFHETVLTFKEPIYRDFTDKIKTQDSNVETTEESQPPVEGLTEDEIKIINGESELERLIQKVKGKFEDDNIAKAYAQKIASNFEELSNESSLKVRSLKDALPGRIQEGLESFASKLGKSVAELTEEELTAFHLESIPQIIKTEIQQINPESLEESEIKILNGDPAFNELIQRVAGKFDDDNSVQRVGGNFDLDDVAFKIASGFDHLSKENNLAVRSLVKQLPQPIKTGLYDFARGLGKDPSGLSNSDINEFRLTRMPSIVQNELKKISHLDPFSLTEDENEIIDSDLKVKELISKSDEQQYVNEVPKSAFNIDEVAMFIAENVEKTSQENNFKVRSLINRLPEKIKTGLYDFAKNLNKEVESLSDKDISDFHIVKMPEIIQAELKDAAENPQSIESGNGDTPFKVRLLEGELSLVKSENEKLRTQAKSLTSEVRILKEARKKLAESQMKAAMAAPSVTEKQDLADDELRQVFQQKLNAQKTLNEMEMKKLASLLERESKIINDLRQEEMKSRKLQLESTQKDNIFSQEIEKAERQVKSKELLIIKTKETFTKLTQKKEQEIADLRNRMVQLESTLSKNSSASNTTATRDLEKQNQQLQKQLEFHKNKIASLVANMQTVKSDDSNFKDEARKLQMMCQQLKNQIESGKSEMEKLIAKTSADAAQVTSLRQEKQRLEQLLKKATLEALESPVLPSNSNTEQELKRQMAQNQILDSQLRESVQKIATLESKLTEALKPQRQASGGDDNIKVKLNQMDASMKKLSQDLVESRNQLSDAKKETNKLRQEKTALQNQIDKLRKEADKSKPAAPKKGKAA